MQTHETEIGTGFMILK